jgi:hypothetical protein
MCEIKNNVYFTAQLNILYDMKVKCGHGLRNGGVGKGS